jgi:hypothetical protein
VYRAGLVMSFQQFGGFEGSQLQTRNRPKFPTSLSRSRCRPARQDTAAGKPRHVGRWRRKRPILAIERDGCTLPKSGPHWLGKANERSAPLTAPQQSITRRVLLVTGVEDMTTRREEEIVVQLVAWITMMLAIAAGAMTMFWLV